MLTPSDLRQGVKITTSGGDGSIDSLLAYDPAGLPAAQHLTQSVAAANANLTVNGVPITSTTNTVTGAIQGVTLNLNNKTTTTASLTVARDTTGITTAVSNFVDAYNALANQLKSRSAFGDATNPAGSLAGNGSVRLMLDQLRSIFITGASGGTLTSLAQVGITSQADGTLALDSTQLDNAMTNDFSDVSHLFTSATGFATRLNAWATNVTQIGGLFDISTNSLNTDISNSNDKITQLEARMTILQQQYTTEYSNLNMLLSNMNSTSTYLNQQFYSKNTA